MADWDKAQQLLFLTNLQESLNRPVFITRAVEGSVVVDSSVPDVPPEDVQNVENQLRRTRFDGDLTNRLVVINEQEPDVTDRGTGGSGKLHIVTRNS